MIEKNKILLTERVFILSSKEALKIATIIDSFTPGNIQDLSDALAYIAKLKEKNG